MLDNKKSRKFSIADFEYPDDCIVDFDFRVIDIFEVQAKQGLKLKDKILDEFERIKSSLKHIPSRMELFLQMDSDLYDYIRTKSKLNIFNFYLDFLMEMDCLSEEEKILYSGRGREFINMIETTSMSKTYKMPLLLAFYNKGHIKMQVNEDDVYQSFYEFYRKGSNKVDMLRHNNTRDFESWGKKEYIKLAKDNPINFMVKTHGDFFKKKDGSLLALDDSLKNVIKLDAFLKHMKDAIDYRVVSYYRNRNFKLD